MMNTNNVTNNTLTIIESDKLESNKKLIGHHSEDLKKKIQKAESERETHTQHNHESRSEASSSEKEKQKKPNRNLDGIHREATLRRQLNNYWIKHCWSTLHHRNPKEILPWTAQGHDPRTPRQRDPPATLFQEVCRQDSCLLLSLRSDQVHRNRGV